MPRPYTLTDLVKLVRAYGVLAGTLDSDRAVVGRVSRSWQAREVEHLVPMASLPEAFFRTPRGRDMIAAELFPDQDIDPETLELDPGDLRRLAAGRQINSNRLPKLETRLHQPVLAANILLGVRLYGAHGQGMKTLSHDWIVATMLIDTIGRPHTYSALSDSDYEIVDESYIFTWFGDRVATLLGELRDYHTDFGLALQAGVSPPPPPSPELASAMAALAASRLRLSARAAGDQVISFMDVASRAELRAAGVDVDADFPEQAQLEADYHFAVAAFALPGVDHYALREPLRNTLLMAVRDVLDDPSKRTRLSGRRGKAVHETHINLPVMEYFAASEAPNSIETVHVASLELMRSLDKGRRKSVGTMTAHAFRIAAIAERVLGRALEPMIVTLAMLHDVVEDGSMRVTGYGHSLRKVEFRFGSPIAAMVSELTDSRVQAAGARKAQLTLEQPHLLMPQTQYNVDRFTRMKLAPTQSTVPYTLSGIVIKLLDTVVSLEEGLRDPDAMVINWRHSGARIYWIERVRGEIIVPLVERLLREISESRVDPRKYKSRPHHINMVRLRAGIALVDTTLSYLDLYTVQNLAILAFEFGLNAVERGTLIDLFFDRNIDESHFHAIAIDKLLGDDRLDKSLAQGRIDSPGDCIMYPKGACDTAVRDSKNLLAYRESALRRQRIRSELGLDSVEKLTAQGLRQEKLLRVFDQRLRETFPDAVLDGARDDPDTPRQALA